MKRIFFKKYRKNCSSVDLLLDSENIVGSSVSGPLVVAKESKELRLYPEPPLDRYFNVIVVTAPSPSNFFVSFFFDLLFRANYL